MYFLPHLPLHLNPAALFGITLLLGLIGDELARRTRLLPRIFGYIAVGFLVGPDVLNIVTPSLLANARIFVDISLGLILFDLGRHLDFTWLRHDRGIILMSATESALTFIFVFSVLILCKLSFLLAALAATIAVATSPAVVMMIAHDLSSKGPFTRRTFILTSLNNLFGLTLFTLLAPMTQPDTNAFIMVGHGIYGLAGSIFLGMLTFYITLGIANLIGKSRENQFVLFVASVIFAIGGATMFHLSPMLTLFTFGVAARNFDHKYLLTEVEFGWLARLFFILLFVITGVHLHLNGLWQATAVVVAFLLARTLAKICGVWLFAKSSRLTRQQAWSLCMTLTPMAGLAIGMSNIILEFNPTLGYELITIITTVVAVLNIIGPIVTQLAFIKSDEVMPNTATEEI